MDNGFTENGLIDNDLSETASEEIDLTGKLQQVGYCGMYCKSCIAYIATNFDKKRLKDLANRMGKYPSDITCNGCRSEKTSFTCKTCKIKRCAIKRKLNFCSECDEYPCQRLKDFQVKEPYTVELYESLDMLKNKSLEEWEEKMKKDYSCPNCGIINSPSYLKCRECGHDPGNPYVERNKAVIINDLTK